MKTKTKQNRLANPAKPVKWWTVKRTVVELYEVCAFSKFQASYQVQDPYSVTIKSEKWQRIYGKD